MTSSIRCLCVALPTLLVSTAVADDFYIPVNLAPFATGSLQGVNSSFPSGALTLGGVPFFIQRGGNNMWEANAAAGDNPRTLTVPVNLTGVRTVYTLISCYWGQNGPGSFASVVFAGDGGATYTYPLVGNANLRDYNQWVWTNVLNDPSASEVFTTGNQRIDMQRIDLPASFANQSLLNVRVVDNGGTNFQRVFISGLSLVIDPPARRVWSTGVGGNGHRYKAVQAPAGITWQQASDAANAAGGHLATINSADENGFVFSMIGGNQAFWFTDAPGNGVGPWIGGQQAAGSAEPAGGWGWVTSEPFSYINWAPLEPNNNNAGAEDRLQYFGYQVPAASTWNDYPGTFTTRGYIIEWGPCIPDLGVQGGGQGQDGILNNNDFIAFIDLFFAQNPAADLGVQGGGQGQDGQFNNNDFIAFIDLFFNGCD